MSLIIVVCHFHASQHWKYMKVCLVYFMLITICYLDAIQSSAITNKAIEMLFISRSLLTIVKISQFVYIQESTFNRAFNGSR
jgi:hypothetical protein